MRAFYLLPASLIVDLATGLQMPDLRPFVQALPNSVQGLLPEALQNNTAHEILKRQYSNTCPVDFNSCSNLGAPSLCCMSNAICSADYAGNVACCPSGAACTGTIGGIITAGTLNSDGVIVGGGAATSSGFGGLPATTATTTSFQFASSTNNGLVAASTPTTVGTDSGQSTNNGFVLVSGTTVATPGAGMRAAQVPFFAKLIIRALEYF